MNLLNKINNNTKNTNLILILILITGSLFPVSCAKPPKEKSGKKTKSFGLNVRYESTIATVDPMGGKVEAKGANGGRPFRLLPSTEVSSLSLTNIFFDRGTSILMDKGTHLLPKENSVNLTSGRVWVEANQEKEFKIKFLNSFITAKKAAFSLSIDKSQAKVFLLRGKLNFHGKKTIPLNDGSFIIKNGVASPSPKDLWIDWTGGASTEKEVRTGYGEMFGHPMGYTGLKSASSPLILRRQKVSVKIRKRIAITTVEQMFFNPASYGRDGEYRLKIPQGASILKVEIYKNKSWTSGSILSVQTGLYFQGDGTFYTMGRGKFGANITNLPISGEVGVRFSYVEKLTEIHGRKIYRYIMNGGPKCGEFELDMRVMEFGAGLRCGFNGKWKKRKFTVLKSDFKPRSDFVAEIFPKDKTGVILEVSNSTAKRRPYLLSVPLKSLSKSLKSQSKNVKKGVSIVLLLDMTGSIDSGKIHLIKTVFSSLLKKFTPSDKLSVMVLHNDVYSLDGAGLSHVNDARIKKLMENLSRLVPGGATNLKSAIETASVMIPQGEGTIIYIGDGQPSRGAMVASGLKSSLEISSPPPIFRTVLVSENGRNDLLEPLGLVYKATTTGELAQVFNKLYKEAHNSSFKQLSAKLGTKSIRITPSKSLPLGIDDTFYSMGFIKKKIPEKAIISGWFEGRKFTKEIPFESFESSDNEALLKLWAYSRVEDLINKGAGYEAVTALAKETGIVTPYTAWSFIINGTIPVVANLPTAIVNELPKLRIYKNSLLKSLPPSNISGIALPDIDPYQYRSGFSVVTYYHRLLNSSKRREAVNECYNRRAIFSPVGGGIVNYEFEVSPDGSLKKFERKYSTLKDKNMLKCIKRAISVMPSLPPPVSGKVIKFIHSYSFASTGNIVPGKCSKLSRSYISKRRKVWRQRLGYRPYVYKVEAEWKKAGAGCELSGWIYKKAFLDIILSKLHTIKKKLSFSNVMVGENYSVQRYIRQKILKSISSVSDAREVVLNYNLSGGMLMGRLIEELRKWYVKKGIKLPPVEKYSAIVDMISKFYAFDPHNAALTLFYVKYAYLAGKKDLAITLAEGIIPRKDLTSSQRMQLAEFLINAKRDRAASMVISSSVELAPYDPYARKVLGDFFRRHNMLKDALAEYTLLHWLLPEAYEPIILMSAVRIQSGEIELGLRGLENLMLTKGNRNGKLLLEKNLAMILRDSRQSKKIKESNVRQRIRFNGLLDDTGKTLIFYKNNSGSSISSSYRVLTKGDQPKETGKKDTETVVWLAYPMMDPRIGLDMIRLNSNYMNIKLKFSLNSGDGISLKPKSKGELIVITNLWKKNQKITKIQISPVPGTKVIYSLSSDGVLSAPETKKIKIVKKIK